MKKYIIIVIIVIIYSCTKNEKENEVEYYSSSNIKSLKKYNNNGYLSKHIMYYDTLNKSIYRIIFKKKQYDSIVYFYKNRKIYKKGLQDLKQRKFGNWYRYTKEGYLSEIREYFIIENNFVLNRQWYIDKKGDTLWYANKFNRYNQKEFANDTLAFRNSSMIDFNFFSKDTIKINDPFAASVICNSPLLRKYNSQIIMVLAKEKNNFNSSFSNIKEVKLDTFYNLNTDKVNRIGFPKANPNYVVVFGRWFDKPGIKKLRGYMIESFKREPTKRDSIINGERKVYFEKTIFVRDR
ncbi:hypothetical protein [Flavobacterium sp. '19STA2R22 D10 B1']|uniref:hypothetical protein n=1 Tax=Flavobacterium aerium TaxID=3037261 RepID=UPI00278C2B49|nr:hypothetical protein [Flavobacterium sp. '19STA2R22 D10 B1']